MPTAATLDKSTLSANSTDVAADGSTTSLITLQAKDTNGNSLTSGGLTVTMATSGNSQGHDTVTDNNDGTYTASITNTTAETVTITATIVGLGDVVETASVTFVPTAATLDKSTLSANSTDVAADGSTTSLITLQAKDTNGDSLTSGGLAVTMATSGNSFFHD